MNKNTLGLIVIVVLSNPIWIGCNQESPKKEDIPVEVKDTVKTVAADSSATLEFVKDTIPEYTNNKFYNDDAWYLAGMKGNDSSYFSDAEKNYEWKEYASWYKSVWDRLEKNQLLKIESWAEKELKDDTTKQSETIFYPFSGADFIYANAFFPEAKQYIMIGLEPVGKVPNIRKIPIDFWENYFLALKITQKDLLSYSFFRTIEMQEDFKIMELKGTLPVLMIFLARTGKKIINLEPVHISDSGLIVKSNAKQNTLYQGSNMRGIEITFSEQKKLGDENTVLKKLYYFSIDISDNSLQKKTGFKKYLESLEDVATLIKSASYLMHKGNFSLIRSIILNNSKVIIQDDSGIPLRFYEEQKKWDIQFYGHYSAPIDLFSNCLQGNLRDRFSEKEKVRTLPFRYGYGSTSNLMVSKRNK